LIRIIDLSDLMYLLKQKKRGYNFSKRKTASKSHTKLWRNSRIKYWRYSER